MSGPDLLAELHAEKAAMIADLDRLVTVESPSSDAAACGEAGEVLRVIADPLIGRGERLDGPNGRSHLLWRFGATIDTLVIGHIDTVFPLGTIDTRPFEVSNGIATGPGVYDMKSGLIQAIYGLAALDDLDGVALLVTDDEEVGSPDSRATIEQLAANASAALVLEGTTGGHAGKLKTARRGVSLYEVHIEGRSAHAGMNPEDGINATIELANVVLATAQLADAAAGTTVTPTVLSSGTAINVIPDAARVSIDARVTVDEEQLRVDRAIREVQPTVPGARLRIDGGPNRPPMPETASAALFAAARAVADELGIGPLEGEPVGGGSDASFVAPLGVPVIDGLGGVGGGGHQADEWVSVDRMPERAALLAAVIDRVRAKRAQNTEEK